MIRKILLVLPVIAILFAPSCKDDDVLKVFSISPQSITFNNEGDSSFVSVYGDKENWEMWIGDKNPATTWCSFNKEFTQFTKEGKGRTEAIPIFSKPNNTREKLTDTLYLLDKSGKYGTIKVSLTLSPVSIEFNVDDTVKYVKSDGIISFDITSNVDSWEIIEKPDGMQYSYVDGVMTFDFGQNNNFVKTWYVKMVGKWTEGKTKNLDMTFIQDPSSNIKGDSTVLVQFLQMQPSMGWNLSTPVSTWNGVQVGNVKTSEGLTGRVIAVNFQDKGMSGQFPALLSGLPYLNVLRLEGNTFTGEFTSDFFLLPYLSTITLSGNNISGTLDDKIFTNSQAMRIFDISGNNFTGTIPESLGNFIKIENLQLKNNNFTGSLPTSIGNLKRLIYFTVNGNKLTGSVPSSYKYPNNANFYNWDAAKNILPQQNGVTLTL